MSPLRKLAVFLLLLSALPAHARVDPPHPAVDPRHIDAPPLNRPVDLTSAFLLHIGDDPAFASPSFDDSGWLVDSTAHPLHHVNISNLDILWYRTHVNIAPSSTHLALELRRFNGTFQIFVNGVEIASSGPDLYSRRLLYFADGVFPIPDTLSASGSLTIAIRANVTRIVRNGGPPGFFNASALLLGPEPTLRDLSSLYNFRQYTSNSANLVLDFIVLLIAFSLALVLRSEREYLALTIGYAAVTFGAAQLVWVAYRNLPTTTTVQLLQLYSGTVVSIAFIEFVRLALALRRTRAVIIYEWALALSTLLAGTSFAVLASRPGAVTAPIAFAVNVLIQLLLIPYDIGLPLVAIWVWFRRRNPDALLLFPSLFLQAVYVYWVAAIYILNHLHLLHAQAFSEPPVPALYVGWIEITYFLFNVSILVFLVLRTLRIARSRAQLSSEIAAAQTVQQLLLARAAQPTPGFLVETAYHPATEVGGDFFLVSMDQATPAPDGSLIAIVGDVSGKGLMAAMRVSMILGVLQRETSRLPAEILHALNEALLAQSQMGFTTACCLHLTSAGVFTVANAGHIAPYIAGPASSRELETPPALPLGLAPDQTYQHVHGLLRPTERIVLLSDGVPEARTAKGELYGFDRLPELTLHAAADIAAAARTFGQEDDITVLTVACLATPGAAPLPHL